MSKVNGIEVLERVRADSALRGLPVIMVSTTDDPREIARCHQLGCLGFFYKDQDWLQLGHEVRRLLPPGADAEDAKI